MSTNKNDPAGDFQSLARQYWTAWTELARQPGERNAGLPGWKDGMAWWSQLAGGGSDGVNAAVERMNTQGSHWFDSMQQLAAGFAGREVSPAEIAKRWSEALGGAAGNPVADMFRRMSGTDVPGAEALLSRIAPMLGAWKGEVGTLLGLPTFGQGREHQERSQQLAQAMLAFQESTGGYSGQLYRAGKLAFERFELKLAEHSEPGRQIESARALFDVWIDAAEEAWGEVALSPEFRHAYGELVNSQMRLRAALQKEVEQVAGMLGLPTRSEVNASHRKVAGLERELRALKSQLAIREAATSRAADKPVPTPSRSPKSAAKASSKVARTAPATAPRAKSVKKPARAKVRAATASRKVMLPQVTAPRAAGRGVAASKTASARSPVTARKGR